MNKFAIKTHMVSGIDRLVDLVNTSINLLFDSKNELTGKSLITTSYYLNEKTNLYLRVKAYVEVDVVKNFGG